MSFSNFLVLVVVGTVAGSEYCINEDGTFKRHFAFTKPENCLEGVFYICDEGIEIRRICPNIGDAFNYLTERCEPDSELICSMPDVCPTNHIAGPHPNGYECEQDCLQMGMCWDNVTSKCLCINTINCPKEAPFQSLCPYRSPALVTCNPAASLEVYPDVSSCGHFYLCIFGNRYRFPCGPGEFYQPDAPSYCDTPENVPPPCGTKYLERIGY